MGLSVLVRKDGIRLVEEGTKRSPTTVQTQTISTTAGPQDRQPRQRHASQDSLRCAASAILTGGVALYSAGILIIASDMVEVIFKHSQSAWLVNTSRNPLCVCRRSPLRAPSAGAGLPYEATLIGRSRTVAPEDWEKFVSAGWRSPEECIETEVGVTAILYATTYRGVH
ncbi:hypothetical protein AcV5_007912 [Taiwanofungus camphoratus]|nr:hypothetical protein AcV7_006084 [Antrodia cinnamomea]KAI0920089.1 hypothetical protein AcV7_006084 [Antrodia cinnamomea]KAI0927358.1 hypothetical protein AcV5_007912 [Antrodia cinnamomea]KAI0927359.1 hypothetical protein AcV5_007912 [Antrodia cinnamomea]